MNDNKGTLADKIAIITGIGEGEAHALAKEGTKVVLVGRTLAKVEKVADDIRSAGGEAMAMRCDVRNREDIDSVVASTVKEFGQIDILVNAISPSSMTPAADMAKHFDTEEKMETLLDDLVATGLVIRRLGHPEQDIGRTVVFLCRPGSAMITGCLINCDGGMAMI